MNMNKKNIIDQLGKYRIIKYYTNKLPWLFRLKRNRKVLKRLSYKSYKYNTIFKYLFPLSFLFIFFIGCHGNIPINGNLLLQDAPSWVINRKDIRYPQAFYLIGFGVSNQDCVSADENARIDLVKQIEMELSGEEISFQLEESKGNEKKSNITQESRVEAKIKTKIDIKIGGITISERWYDEYEKKHYSLATLDRDMATEILKKDIHSELEEIDHLYLLGIKNEKNQNFINALKNYQKAYGKRDDLYALTQRYWAIRDKGLGIKIKDKKEEFQNNLKLLSEIKERLDNLIYGINIVSIEGDNQKLHSGGSLKNELVIKVFFEDNKMIKKYPISDMPVKIDFNLNTTSNDIGYYRITDKNGVAKFRIYQIDKLENSINNIFVSINLEGFDELNKKKAVFTYYTPPTISHEQDDYSWHEGIIKIVEDIISKIYDEGVIRVAVLDFVEARSEDRLNLSRIIESDIRTTLANVEDLIVIDTGNPGGDNEDLRERAKFLKADIYITGVYWLYDDALRINAKLVDTNKGTLISTGSATIAKINIDKDGLQKENSYTASPINNSNSLYDILVDKLYFEEKDKQKFNIDIWTDKKEYNIGDMLNIYIKSDKDCYLNILDIGTSGKLTLLFPNSLDKDNFIKGGITHTIPSENWGFDIEVLEPAGLERIKAIATSEPFSLVDAKFKENFYSIDKKNIKALRDIKIRINNLSSIVWSQASTEIIILSKEDNKKRHSRGFKKKTTDKPQSPIDIIGTTGAKEEGEE